MNQDTNLVAVLLEALAKKTAMTPAGGGASETMMIVTMVIAALGPIIAAVVALIQAKATAEAKAARADMAAVVEKVHVAVNSGQTAIVEKARAADETAKKELADLRAEVLRITKDLATSEGEVKTAAATAKVIAGSSAP